MTTLSHRPDVLKKAIDRVETIVIGAGAGLSTSAGFIYTGERFERYFGDFAKKYQFKDMYTGGFYPFQTPNEQWAYWSRYVYINRYQNPPKPLYSKLYDLVKEKEYFVLTTNVDHCFQKAGFDKNRLFYTQGDYGLFQCSEPCHNKTYDNQEIILEMVKAQGYQTDKEGNLVLPVGVTARMSIPDELLPVCPKCGKRMSMNLRADATFVQDKGWEQAAHRYECFLEQQKETTTLFLELGVGYNTPSIIKYPFWIMANDWKFATYACLNQGEAFIPEELCKNAICINGDIGEILGQL